MSPFMLLVLLVVVVIVFVVVLYNKMIKMRNQADEAWSDIDVQLKRRYNLIPNIVETVKGYATHEEGVFTKVTEARSNAINAGSLKEQAQAENMLSGALKSLFAVAENYPDLKANENFMQLQNELVDTEDKIQAARRFYNSTVRDFNTKLQQFPNSVVAKIFKFEDKEFFEVEDEEQKKNVEVSFDKDKEEVKEEAAPAAKGNTDEKTAEAPATTEEPKEEEKPAEEAPTEPAKPSEAESEGQAKCPKCGGEMAEGHVCPMPEKTEEAPAEAPKEDKPQSEEGKSSEATDDSTDEKAETTPVETAKCPKCGGEMTEGHTCPMPVVEDKPEEPTAEEAPAEAETPKEAVAEEPKEEVKLAEPSAPAEDKPQSEEGKSGEATKDDTTEKSA